MVTGADHGGEIALAGSGLALAYTRRPHSRLATSSCAELFRLHQRHLRLVLTKRPPRFSGRRSFIMSKITVAGVRTNVQQLLEYSNETKKRNFLETVELQIGLKNCKSRHQQTLHCAC